MDTVIIRKHDSVYNRIIADPGIIMEIADHFTFEVPNAKFHPMVRNKVWDGRIRLLNPLNGLLYCGLAQHLTDFCQKRDYEVEYEGLLAQEEFSLLEAKDRIASMNLTKTPRDYQIDAYVHAVRNRRSVLLSPTASGKSLIIYMLTQHYDTKTLIIVPTTSLVHQMASDFYDYGLQEEVHKIMSGEEKTSNKRIFCSTWQSIYKLPASWFAQFNLVIGDECLHPETKITMADNTKKEIQDIKIGDYVKTYNEKTNLIENKKVIKVHENLSIEEDFYEVETASGNKLRITGNHKVLLKNGNWTEVRNLKEGDIINSIE